MPWEENVPAFEVYRGQKMCSAVKKMHTCLPTSLNTSSFGGYLWGMGFQATIWHFFIMTQLVAIE